MIGNASATYRGYRKQGLYALARILEDADPQHVYRPEGDEDLAVYDSGARLLEAVQVKDYTDGLSVSDLKPTSPNGFFSRMAARLRTDPHAPTVLASFGPIGPELDAAIRGEAPQRSRVVAKLQPIIAPAEAGRLLDALNGNVVRLDEGNLRSRIMTILDGSFGLDPRVTLDLLLLWIYVASENRTPLSRSSLLSQVERIGKYVAALRDITSEFLTSIVPINDSESSELERAQLVSEYRQGAHARWEHILADADVPRPERLSAVHSQVTQCSVTIIRGASGQGKSSLGWRYLREYATEGLRFQVRFLKDRNHAASVANALRSHARRLQMQPLVYLDLSASDAGWTQLARDLVSSGFKVLVAAREEDLYRAGPDLSDIRVGEVHLQGLSRGEAEAVYGALLSLGTPDHLLGFDDAWSRFSAGANKPLLEFTHLVSQGQSLGSKIGEQIDRAQREARSDSRTVTPTGLRLLATCAIANAAETRVDYRLLCSHAGLDPLTAPLAPFEREYLVRCREQDGQITIEGLHPLRSQAIVDALLNEDAVLLADLAVELLAIVCDTDMEKFLLHYFSRSRATVARLEASLLTHPPRSWTDVAAIVRSLLWLGISRYEEINRNELRTPIKEYGPAWYLLGDVMFGLGQVRANLLAELAKRPVQDIPLTPKEDMLAPMIRWIQRVRAPESPPVTGSDWRGAGEAAFWIGTRELSGQLRDSLSALLPQDPLDGYALSDLGAYVSGRWTLPTSDLAEWHTRSLKLLKRRIVMETQSLGVEDDGGTIKIFFPILMSEGAEGWRTDTADLSTQSSRRIDLLRALVPNRKRYDAQGVGFELLESLQLGDESRKSIPAENLPDERLVRVNATMSSLVSYRHQRVEGWSDYLEVVGGIRSHFVDCSELLHQFWERLLAEGNPRDSTIRTAPLSALKRAGAESFAPMLPKAAVDEWGFVSEGRSSEAGSDSSGLAARVSLASTRTWSKAFQNYHSAMVMVAGRAEGATVRHVKQKRREGDADQGGRATDAHLVLVNLGAAWRALAGVQNAFKDLWSATHDEAFCQRERAALEKLWFVAYAFISEPLHRRKDATRFLIAEFATKRTQFLEDLQRECAATAQPHRVVVHANGAFIEGRPSLVVEWDHGEPRSLADAARPALEACWRASQKQKWAQFQCEPLLREWEEVVIVTTYERRLISAAVFRMPISILFLMGPVFDAGGASTVLQAVPLHDLERLGLVLWDAPLVRTLVAWRDATASAFFAVAKTRLCAAFVDDHSLDEEATTTVEVALRRELTKLRDEVHRTASDLFTVLRSITTAAGGAGAVERLRTMVAPRPGEDDELDEGFPPYVVEFAESPAGLLTLVADVLAFAVRAESGLPAPGDPGSRA